MTTWKWSVGWTRILSASIELGRAVGFTVGGPHGPGLIVSHHCRARLRSDHRHLIQAVQQPNRVCQETQHTPHSTFTHMHTLSTPSYMTTNKCKVLLFCGIFFSKLSICLPRSCSLVCPWEMVRQYLSFRNSINYNSKLINFNSDPCSSALVNRRETISLQNLQLALVIS